MGKRAPFNAYFTRYLIVAELLGHTAYTVGGRGEKIIGEKRGGSRCDG